MDGRKRIRDKSPHPWRPRNRFNGSTLQYEDSRGGTSGQPNFSGPRNNGGTSQSRSQQGRGRQDYSDARSGNNYRSHSQATSQRGRGFRNDNGQGQQSDSKRRRDWHSFSIKHLENLLQEPVEGAMQKIVENEHFTNLLMDIKFPDYYTLILQLLSKVCDSAFQSLKVQILLSTLNDKFLQSLQAYVTSLPFGSRQKKDNIRFWKNPDEFWKSLIRVFETILKQIPQNFTETFLTFLKVTQSAITLFETNHQMHVADDTKNGFKNLLEFGELIISANEKKKLKDKVEQEEGEPPEDFREISVYPTTVELIHQKKPFLRKNVIEGPYRNVDHYLDVQYRLLREDFIGPLRNGIRTYITKSGQRLENVKIHKRVQFLSPVTITEHFCVIVKFNFTNKPLSFKYEKSKRFIFGSLLCFTQDDFKNMIFGRIIERKEEYLRRGEIVVGFEEQVPLSYLTDYVMIECGIYFEPYYHVLSVLKELNEDNFPMRNYVIDVNTAVVQPDYLAPDTIFRISSFSRWIPMEPSNQVFFNFNDSQNRAFKAALTREFSVIQGPPGTGKTYVALKIAETLLNSRLGLGPTLVLCYTNHALDQFLEGLIPLDRQMVRIGGQSKSEKMNQYNLRNISHFKSEASFRCRMLVQQSLAQLKAITDSLEMIGKFECVIDFKVFNDVVPLFDDSWLYEASKEAIIQWLLGSTRQFANADDEALQMLQNFNINDNDNEVLEEERDEENDNENEVNEMLNLLGTEKDEPGKAIIDLKELEKNITKLRIQMDTLVNNDYEAQFKLARLDYECQELMFIYKTVRERLTRAKFAQRVKRSVYTPIDSAHIPLEERWNLYFHWLFLYEQKLLRQHEEASRRFRIIHRNYRESKDMENVNVLRKMDIIGITTTGAARLRSTLQTIHCPIVIVEEAAEVLESHIVSSVTKKCKQLILIGDHQQLKPSTSNYQVERFYNLGISLFERMILNGVQCFTLDVQHRMRPEISSLIRPTIYPKLIDHESVKQRPNILGVRQCLYFITHKNPEISGTESTSKRNPHEAKFMIQLAKYLLLNGYESHQITILAAYLGQMFEMLAEKDRYLPLLKDVRITVLDNYQGEESDIILLSLVRNNEDNKIGFLSIENRVCVALSRARNGMYIMGNMDLLTSNSEVWKKINDTFVEQNAIGTALDLHCRIHGVITEVSKADDFQLVAEGGCNRVCGMVLACRHTCTRLCHIMDREHANNKCLEVCNKLLCDANPEHICRKPCYRECGPCHYRVEKTLNCGHKKITSCSDDPLTVLCQVELPVTLVCGHDTMRFCYVDPEKVECPFPCEVRVDCGHSCLKNCHVKDDPDHLEYKCPKKCERQRMDCSRPDDEQHKCIKLCYEECPPCGILVKKQRSCSHAFDVPCNELVDLIKCEKPCKKILDCSHNCKNKCNEKCGPCKINVTKIVPECNHKVQLLCHVTPSRWLCNGKCPQLLSCGHICKLKCNVQCDELKCKEMVAVSIIGKCGHEINKIPCNLRTLHQRGQLDEDETPLEAYCSTKCNEVLNCAHTCSGTCGECFQGRVHKRCAEKCGLPLICNHECTVNCRETCKPCTQKCSYRCRHSKCNKRCSEQCVPCKEKCPQGCPHRQCTKLCGDICNVPPCTEPCPKSKKCGHPCVGFCGDPCPPLCGICDKEELEECFFGTEEEGARYVLLRDCGHVLESSGMEMWLKQENSGDATAINFKVCPKCKTNIYTTERYGNYVKEGINDMAKIKTQQYGTKGRIQQKREDIIKQLTQLQLACQQISPTLQKIFGSSLLILKKRLEVTRKGRVQFLNLMELDSVSIKTDLIKETLQILKGVLKKSTKIEMQVKFVMENIFVQVDDITSTQISDIQREIKRLNRIIQFDKIDETRYNSEPFIVLKSLIYRPCRYDDGLDQQIKEHLKKFSISTTELERREIVKAMGLKKGHWFKCPNGHIYCITECGGAMQTSICPECKERIGGSNHTLLSSNAVATEMDGATHSAWSEAANMANYGF